MSYDPNHWSLCHTTFLQCADCPDLVGPWGLKVVLTSEAWLECACCGSGGAEIIPCQLPRTHGALSSEGLLGSGSLGARKHKLCNKQQPHTFLYSLVSHLLEKVSVEQGHFPPAQPPTCPLCSPPPRLCVCMLMVVKGDMMVNFIYLLDWATKCAEGPSNIIFCMSMSVFLDETTFELINWGKQVALPKVGGSHLTCWRLEKNPQQRKRKFSLSAWPSWSWDISLFLTWTGFKPLALLGLSSLLIAEIGTCQPPWASSLKYISFSLSIHTAYWFCFSETPIPI